MEDVFRHLIAHDLNDSFFQGGFGKGIQEPIAVVEMEGNMRIGQGYANEFIDDVLQLDGIVFKEIPSSGNIEKQIFYGKGGSRIHGYSRLAFELIPFDDDFGSELVVLPFGLQGNLCYGRNGGHGFAPETQGLDVEKIVGRFYFRRGVPFEAQACIDGRHSFSIVDDLDEAFARLLNN
jgi:hypothetical protein